MDWSENAKLFQCWQKKSAYYYYDTQVPVNTAAVYQANKSTNSVGFLSDNTSHKKTAVWASLKSTIYGINLDVDRLEQLFLIIDSPSSHYRNVHCVFLVRKFGLGLPCYKKCHWWCSCCSRINAWCIGQVSQWRSQNFESCECRNIPIWWFQYWKC